MRLAFIILTACASSTPPTALKNAGGDRTPTIDVIPPASFVRGASLDWLLNDEEPPTTRVAAWTFETDDEPVLAQLEVHARPRAPAGTVDAWSMQLANEVGGAEDDVRSFNYYVAWIDEHRRFTAEWAWVGKGERVETYDRVVALGDRVWHVRLMLNGHAPRELGAWLRTVFDEPLATRAPTKRRSLATENTPR